MPLAPYINVHHHGQNSEEKDTYSVECVLYPYKSSNRYSKISYGVHPADISLLDEDSWLEVERQICAPNVVAVGEAGLDKLCGVDLEQQYNCFIKQIILSEQYQKPLIIHCVRAFDELIALKKKYKPIQPWLIHGFRGKRKQAEQLLHLGFYLSFGRYFNADSLTLAYWEGKCLLENDMHSVPISDIYREVAIVLTISIEELREQVYITYQSVFKD